LPVSPRPPPYFPPRYTAVLSGERFTAFGLAEALPAAAALTLVALVPMVALRALRAAR
jgi:hypothetical protein